MKAPLEVSPVALKSGEEVPARKLNKLVYTAQDAGVVIATLDRVEKLINKELRKFNPQYIEVHKFAKSLLSKLREV